jgi:hypothetical protein
VQITAGAASQDVVTTIQTSCGNHEVDRSPPRVFKSLICAIALKHMQAEAYSGKAGSREAIRAQSGGSQGQTRENNP